MLKPQIPTAQGIERPHYGLIVCTTNNIGDDIQSYAVSLLMPPVDIYINREKISDWHPECKTVIAGWYKHKPLDWPPHENIIPLFLAFHAADRSCVSMHKDYLARVGPIGCRDTHTMSLCRNQGIEAYFSGCVTLTLPQLVETVTPIHKPVFIGVSAPSGVEHVKTDVSIKAQFPTHRLIKARERLELLASASCVVTSRLHVALPCAAMGVPVLLIPPLNDARFGGLLEFVNYLNVYDSDAIKAFIENPKANPNTDRRLQVADQLRKRVAEFYGEIVIESRGWQISKKVSTDEAVGKFVVAQEPGPFEVGPIHHHGDISKFAPSKPVSRLPATGVLELEGAGVLGNDGWVIDSSRQLVVGLSWYGDEMASRVKIDKMPINSRRRIRGRALNLASTWSSCNYGHCLMESIGRLSVAEAAGWSLRDFDYVLMPYFKVRDIENMLERLEIDRSKLLHSLNPTELLVFDELVAPTINGAIRHYRSGLPEWAKRRILTHPPSGCGRRLFVRRNCVSRRIKNEAEIERIAQLNGFELLDPVATPNSFLAFSQAECIAGVHQAAFANLMFARPGCRFLELLPTSHQYLYYASLAKASGLEYHCLLVDSDDYCPGVSCISPSRAGVSVDTKGFSEAIAAIVKGL